MTMIFKNIFTCNNSVGPKLYHENKLFIYIYISYKNIYIVTNMKRLRIKVQKLLPFFSLRILELQIKVVTVCIVIVRDTGTRLYRYCFFMMGGSHTW